MILYHFTLADRAEHILKDGMRPYHDINKMVGGAEVVWLTERTDLSISAAEKAVIFEKSGRLMNAWLSYPERRVVRLAVGIRSRDRRLVTGVPVCLTRTQSL